MTAEPTSPPAAAAETGLCRCEAGATLYRAGASGRAWRVEKGSLRLDRVLDDGERVFASLAVAGDVIGAETLLLGTHTFEAVALAECELTPWPEGLGRPAGESLLQTLTAVERRAADVIALRGGQAMERVTRLIQLLARRDDKATQVVLPPRRDIADITALTIETVSRTITALKRSGFLVPVKRGDTPALNRFICP
ncbi:MAG: hypothetical protein RIR00_1805 [Pseudomonadota bacterium]